MSYYKGAIVSTTDENDYMMVQVLNLVSKSFDRYMVNIDYLEEIKEFMSNLHAS